MCLCHARQNSSRIASMSKDMTLILEPNKDNVIMWPLVDRRHVNRITRHTQCALVLSGMSQGGRTHLLAHDVHLDIHQDFVQFRKENYRYQSMRHVQRKTRLFK